MTKQNPNQPQTAKPVIEANHRSIFAPSTLTPTQYVHTKNSPHEIHNITLSYSSYMTIKPARNREKEKCRPYYRNPNAHKQPPLIVHHIRTLLCPDPENPPDVGRGGRGGPKQASKQVSKIKSAKPTLLPPSSILDSYLAWYYQNPLPNHP